MKKVINRRSFLKTTGALGAGIGLTGLGGSKLLGAVAGKGAPNAEKLGWQLGCAAYSFNQLSFYEAIEKTASLGLHSIEMFDWQKLSKEKPDIETNEAMSAADRREAKSRLADAGVKLVSCYCRKLDEKDTCRARFDYAKEMGIGILVAEPPFEAYDMIEKFCDQYQINLAVHNHPQPSQYWNPETLAKLAKGRSKRIGSCADTGHWARSGFQPVKALKMLEGRVISFHLKDISEFGITKAECVPWGTGEADVAGVLKETLRQGFKGFFGIEYEPYSPENLPKIEQCVAYFDKVAAELSSGASG